MVVTWIELEEGKVLGKSISHFKTQDLLVFGVILSTNMSILYAYSQLL